MSSFIIVKQIAADPEIIFDALIEPDGLRAWIGPDDGPVLLAETEPRVGGKFRLRFQMLDGSEHEATGEYLEIDRPRTLAMTWQWQTHEDRTVSRIDISLRESASGTELTFSQSQLPSDRERDGHREGWNASIGKLIAHLERRSR